MLKILAGAPPHKYTQMPLQPTIKRVAANWKQSRDGQPIRCLVIHDTERPSQDTNSIAYLQRGGALPDGSDKRVSTHILIQPNGVIYEMVDDEFGANHAGYGRLLLGDQWYGPDQKYNINDISLSCELEYTKAPFNGPYPEAQLLAMGWWIVTKRKRYDHLPIFRHQYLDPTRRSDPRNLSNAQIELWASRAAAMMTDLPTPNNPHKYRMVVPQVVYTAPNLGSRFAGDQFNPLVLNDDQEVPIGKIEANNWLWLATGWGFIPPNTAIRI